MKPGAGSPDLGEDSGPRSGEKDDDIAELSGVVSAVYEANRAAKADMDAAEVAARQAVIDAVMPVLPELCGPVPSRAGESRGVKLGDGVYLFADGSILSSEKPLGPAELADAVCAVLERAIRGNMVRRTGEMRARAALLNSVAHALRFAKP